MMMLDQQVEHTEKPEKVESFSYIDRLARGEDVVTNKRAAVLEAHKTFRGPEAFAVIDEAERRGVVVGLSKQLEEKYGVKGWGSEMARLFDGYHQQNLSMSFEEFRVAVIEEYGEDAKFQAMLAQEPLVLDYLYGQITGRSGELSKAVFAHMVEKQNSWKARLNDNTVEIETSIRRIYGEESVLANFICKRGGTTDTPISIFIPISGKEHMIYEKKLSGGDGVLNFEAGDFMKLVGYIHDRSRLVGMQHGYGADRRVYRQIAGRWLETVPENRLVDTGREIGIAMTTKGGERTTLRDKQGKIISGHMDLAAVQQATVLQALGLVGWDVGAETEMIGHSMGGQEMFWLAMYAQQGWKMSYEALTPVVTNDQEFLTLFGGKGKQISDIPGLLNRLSAEVPRMLAQVTKNERMGEVVGRLIGKVATTEIGKTSLGKLIASYLIDSGEKLDLSEVVNIIRIHVENLQDYWYTQAVFQALNNDNQLNEEMLQMMWSFYGEKFRAVWVAEDDRILDPKQMKEVLERSGWGSKIRVLRQAGHYAQTAESHAVPFSRFMRTKNPAG